VATALVSGSEDELQQPPDDAHGFGLSRAHLKLNLRQRAEDARKALGSVDPIFPVTVHGGGARAVPASPEPHCLMKCTGEPVHARRILLSGLATRLLSPQPEYVLIVYQFTRAHSLPSSLAWPLVFFYE